MSSSSIVDRVERVDDSLSCDGCTYITWFNSKDSASVAKAKKQLAKHQQNCPPE